MFVMIKGTLYEEAATIRNLYALNNREAKHIKHARKR